MSPMSRRLDRLTPRRSGPTMIVVNTATDADEAARTAPAGTIVIISGVSRSPDEPRRAG